MLNPFMAYGDNFRQQFMTPGAETAHIPGVTGQQAVLPPAAMTYSPQAHVGWGIPPETMFAPGDPNRPPPPPGAGDFLDQNVDDSFADPGNNPTPFDGQAAVAANHNEGAFFLERMDMENPRTVQQTGVAQPAGEDSIMVRRSYRAPPAVAYTGFATPS